VGVDLPREAAPELMRKVFEVIKAHLAEKGLMMREGTIVDLTLFAAPPSTTASGLGFLGSRAIAARQNSGHL
jgi:hypothetical protein